MILTTDASIPRHIVLNVHETHESIQLDHAAEFINIDLSQFQQRIIGFSCFYIMHESHFAHTHATTFCGVTYEIPPEPEQTP